MNHYTLVTYGVTKDIITNRNLSTVKTIYTVGDLKTDLFKDYPLLRNLNSLAIAVDEEYRDDDYLLKDGDEVVLIPPVSGG